MMAYPSIAAPYGLQPVNLIGGLPFAGSTRALPIQYGYNADIFYGDFVKLSAAGDTGGAGFAVRASVSTGTTNNQVTGIFVGCTFTNPVTKQKQFSQYWPTGTLAGDGVAYVVDDPNAVFKAVVCSATTVVASGAYSMLGANLSMINNTGSTSTGNSRNAVLAPTDTPVTTILPVRCVGIVEETAIPVVATGSSSGTAITLTGSGLPRAIPVGTDVAYLAPNGQLIRTGSFVDVAKAAGGGLAGDTIAINIATASANTATPIPVSSTIVFTIYPEILVKVNQLVHGYLSSTAV
jgi:hypothetical protein